MKTYLAVARLRFIGALQYRAAALGGLATQFVWGFMEILAFTAFYRSDPAAFPMAFPQLVSYIWMQECFLALFSLTMGDRDLTGAIESGSIAYEMVRPVDLYGRWFCQAAANRLARTLLRSVPILLVAFLLPEPYRMSLPADLAQLGLFVVSMGLALWVVVAFSMLMYVSVFYTLSARGTGLVVGLLADFLAGAVIPLAFFPDAVRGVAELLPFAAMQNMPLRIYSGNIAGMDALRGIALQVFWGIVLLILGRIAMARAQKKVIVQGG